ncbi:hypothetical protein SOVF_186310 [Spinacia oleracea]|uniref:Methyl-CpG-binding domain-containing protein 11-like n=1 Tax=Spinacia oleracea TaxID=3562 RepID=A0ABM3QKS4_SPIOL|nr:methyl-CpG-binding domain-containing protein 11-like [Spinacia oleracea]KNA05878.1 hypothetical protein SOVF_186310 [Spinacia oleracea]
MASHLADKPVIQELPTSQTTNFDQVVTIELPAPQGWTKKFIPKKGGTGTPRRNEIVFIAPSGEEIKNKRQLEQYLKTHPDGPCSSKFDWGTGDTPRRSARLSSKSRETDTPESGSRQKKSRSNKEETDGVESAAADREDDDDKTGTGDEKDVEMKDNNTEEEKAEEQKEVDGKLEELENSQVPEENKKHEENKVETSQGKEQPEKNKPEAVEKPCDVELQGDTNNAIPVENTKEPTVAIVQPEEDVSLLNTEKEEIEGSKQPQNKVSLVQVGNTDQENQPLNPDQENQPLNPDQEPSATQPISC